MITTKSLGAAGIAVFMLGVAAGYTLTKADPAPEAARFRVKTVSPQMGANDQQATVVASDGLTPVLAWLQQGAEASH